jgi:hypothetical protein
MDGRRWSRRPHAIDDGGRTPTYPTTRSQTMTLTPGLTLLGVLLVLVSIPLAFSIGPLVIGLIVLAFGLRRAHEGLAASQPTPAALS